MTTKKQYLAIAIFTMNIQGRDILVNTNEGIFDNEQDAINRVNDMASEESQNNDEMYFEIKTVFA